MSGFFETLGALWLFLLLALVAHSIIIGVSGLWKFFIKAGKPGWLAFVPVVNILVLWNIAHVLTLGIWVGLSVGVTAFIKIMGVDYFESTSSQSLFVLVATILGQWLPICFFSFCVNIRMSKLFGYGLGFGLGMIFFTPIFGLILFWGNSRIQEKPDYGWYSKVDDGGWDFEVLLALRYLRPKRTAVSFITLISVMGVTLGVAVLVIVTSVFSGFHLQLKKTFFQFSADVQVRQVAGDNFGNLVGVPIPDYQRLAERMESVEGVTGAMPIVVGKVMLETQREGMEPAFDAPKLIGVDEEGMSKVSQVPQSTVLGEFDLSGNGLVVGWNFGRPDGAFRLNVGDTVLIYSPQSLKEMKDAKEEGETLGILPEEYTVKGIFDAGQGELNDFIFCDIWNAQDLYHMEDDVAHMVWAETDQPLNLKPIKAGLQQKLGAGFHIGTWEDLNPVLLAQVEVEKMVTQFLMFFIVIVAAFGIASSLIIFGVQKTKEIGLLKALGATNGQVSNVFLIQSAVVGVLGTAFGVGLGMLVLKYRNEFLGFMRGKGVELFPEKLYGFRELPAQIVQSDVLIICGVSLVICVVAGLLPAWNAARLQPVEALRNE